MFITPPPLSLLPSDPGSNTRAIERPTTPSLLGTQGTIGTGLDLSQIPSLGSLFQNNGQPIPLGEMTLLQLLATRGSADSLFALPEGETGTPIVLEPGQTQGTIGSGFESVLDPSLAIPPPIGSTTLAEGAVESTNSAPDFLTTLRSMRLEGRPLYPGMSLDIEGSQLQGTSGIGEAQPDPDFRMPTLAERRQAEIEGLDSWYQWLEQIEANRGPDPVGLVPEAIAPGTQRETLAERKARELEELNQRYDALSIAENGVANGLTDEPAKPEPESSLPNLTNTGGTPATIVLPDPNDPEPLPPVAVAPLPETVPTPVRLTDDNGNLLIPPQEENTPIFASSTPENAST